MKRVLPVSVLIICWGLLGVTGCKQRRVNQESQAKIWNGKPLGGVLPIGQLIVSTWKDQRVIAIKNKCTGTLIAADIFITAGHCFFSVMDFTTGKMVLPADQKLLVSFQDRPAITDNMYEVKGILHQIARQGTASFEYWNTYRCQGQPGSGCEGIKGTTQITGCDADCLSSFVGKRDVALVKLDRPVEENSPARVGIFDPVSKQPQIVSGFGKGNYDVQTGEMAMDRYYFDIERLEKVTSSIYHIFGRDNAVVGGGDSGGFTGLYNPVSDDFELLATNLAFSPQKMASKVRIIDEQLNQWINKGMTILTNSPQDFSLYLDLNDVW